MLISLIVCILGLVLYLITDKPKPTRIGEIMFFLGLAFTLYIVSGGKVF